MKYLLLNTAYMLFWTGLSAQQTVKVMELRLENYAYPFEVRYLPVEVQREQFEMAYMDVQSDHPTGETIMLLHGKNFNGAYWEQTARALATDGYRVIIPDQLGFGKSSKPNNLQYSFHVYIILVFIGHME